MSQANLLKVTLVWTLVGPDEWEYSNPVLLKPIAKVTYLQPNERERKGFKFEAEVGLPSLIGRPSQCYGFRTVAGAKRFVENWCIQKGKVE